MVHIGSNILQTHTYNSFINGSCFLPLVVCWFYGTVDLKRNKKKERKRRNLSKKNGLLVVVFKVEDSSRGITKIRRLF